MNQESHPVARDVVILKNGDEFVRAKLDLLRLPGGGVGVKWGGLAFPLHSGDRIELSDQGVPPDRCSLWAESTVGWRLVPGPADADAYLFIDGNAQARDQAVRTLEGAGIAILRSGPNLSDSAGDWFIRIDQRSAGSLSRISELLGEAIKLPPAEEGGSLRERLLIDALGAAKTAQGQLRTELERAQNAAVALSIKSDGESALKVSLEAMAMRLAEVEKEAEALRARADAAPRPQSKPNRLETELTVAVTALLPRLDLVGNSMNFIAVELPDRAILWRALEALDAQERGQPKSWKSLSGHSGWWERHFSTGQDNQGRIYARATGQPARWQVLVSHKQDQAADLRRIDRL